MVPPFAESTIHTPSFNIYSLYLGYAKEVCKYTGGRYKMFTVVEGRNAVAVGQPIPLIFDGRFPVLWNFEPRDLEANSPQSRLSLRLLSLRLYQISDWCFQFTGDSNDHTCKLMRWNSTEAWHVVTSVQFSDPDGPANLAARMIEVDPRTVAEIIDGFADMK